MSKRWQDPYKKVVLEHSELHEEPNPAVRSEFQGPLSINRQALRIGPWH